MSIHACTIIARNYLAAARVLARSFFEHHPDGTFSTLIVDESRADVDRSTEPFEVLNPEDVGFDRKELHRLAAIYDVMEFATAVKPWLLEHLIRRWDDEVFYFDPDIVIYAPLGESFEGANECELVVTPHVTKPIPRDGLMIDERHILSSGVFNMGFIGVGPRSSAFLGFWKQRLLRECVIDKPNMRFVDQRWVDFAPGIFDVRILKDPTLNVAYWNLDQRSLTSESGRYYVDGKPLRFFHFSGYSPNQPELLSKYQGPKARILLSERPVLAQLCADYRSSLEGEGYRDASRSPFAFARMSNGVKLDSPGRLAYREALVEAEARGDKLPPNPFDDAREFLGWLTSVAPGRRLSRYLSALWQSSDKLRTQYPNAEYRDYGAFVSWCGRQARQGRIDFRLIPGEVAFARSGLKDGSDLPDPTSTTTKPGVEVWCGFQEGSTSERISKALFAALKESAIPYSGAQCSNHQDPSSTPQSADDLPQDFNVNLVCVDVEDFTQFSWRVGLDTFESRYTIGLWPWTFEDFASEYVNAIEHVDEVWTTSEFARQAMAKRVSTPIYVIPLPVVPPSLLQQASLPEAILPGGGFVFLGAFDMARGFERANPMGLLDAFKRAFAPNEGPKMAIYVENGRHDLAMLEHLKIASSARPDVFVLEDDQATELGSALFSLANCYVSLDRAEAFSWRIAEAMSLRKPVIATAYSGNLEYMAESNSYSVPFNYVRVPAGSRPFGTEVSWADPDLVRAAEFMRNVYENEDDAAACGVRAEVSVAERFGIASASDFITKRFEFAQFSLAEQFFWQTQDRSRS